METAKTRINDLAGNVREYIETRFDIVKLDAAETGASAASGMVTWIAISVAAIFTLLMLSLGAAIGIGYLMDNFAAGFFILAGFYLLVAIAIYYNRETWIKIPILNNIIKTIYEND